ncbi:DUF2975 domain-containing protein [Enterococcus dongliensis]|uniref:DUF2975 domain-containing protein n=1 Tax=Enterococcus dongliensis TaxID=2559925 RepID=A0AAW8TN25_9ENTE|nr:DUF2975 domain-containing protein [Enterococcus dongliensis]MDT2596202.1 DUF2975 domain-containing protein [Enterococcus dongliensis]MDT2603923.1 DUF2975 domain-containing protein [Enterococcus dongliensis]MDT2634181.1 DUF2975 domain-containing protein [Enterococcus dongliensis]MDT2637111.1 DUF2975 domain-containing protein [Enterococcus dongliensis]MDT2642476.1 DUF2975 domain-containing protein [Enterococcus dongliensis]
MNKKINFLNAALVLISLLVVFITVVFSIQFFSEEIRPFFVSCLFVSFIVSVLLGFRVLFLLAKMLRYIKKSEAFSMKTLKVVSAIKKTILLISIAFLGILPFFYTVADRQDAPGILVIGFALVLLPFTAFIFSQIVEELFKNAAELKTDNELTI